jgi:hypothetical protein
MTDMGEDAARFAPGSPDSPANSPDGTTHIGLPDGVRVGGDEEGRSSPGQQHGDIGNTRAAAVPAAENLLGTGGEARRLSELPWDTPLKLAEVKARFEAMTAARLTRGKTREEYWRRFRAFAECEGLGQYTKRQLAGDKGRELLIRHYAHISERSRPFVLSGIKKVWTRGIGLPWPLEKDDLPRPARPRRGVAPRREYVERWIEAARREPDAYARSWLMVELNGGLRPIDQQAELRMEDLVFNAAEEPIGIHAQAADHGFKRDADIRQCLPSEVAAALKDWLKEHPAPSAKAYVWPWRGMKPGLGKRHIDANGINTDDTISRMRRNFVDQNRLPWLTSKDMRHFVRTVLNDSGMKKVERHYYQGHAFNPADMDERYGDKPAEETFDAQRHYLPQGILGTFLRIAPTDQGVPGEVREIWSRLLAGELESSEAAEVLRGLARAQRQVQAASDLVKP